MKRTIVKTTFLLLSFVSLIALSSCEKDNPHGGGGKDPDVIVCNTYGTFTKVLCGVSIYDNYWIKTDDGHYLQPCETDVVTLTPLTVKEGTRIKFAYKKISGKSACDQMVTCMAYDERMAGSTKVRITCIEIVSQPQDPTPCTVIGTVQFHSSCKLKTIKDDKGNVIEPQNQTELTSYAPGARVMYGYTPLLTLSITCTGAQGAQIDCIRSIMTK